MIRFMEGILLRKAAEDVARVLSGAGHTVYFVGGCVRDRLLGYSVKDIDIATSARPDEVLRLFPDAWEVGAPSAWCWYAAKVFPLRWRPSAETEATGMAGGRRPSVSRMRKKMPGGVILP